MWESGCECGLSLFLTLASVEGVTPQQPPELVSALWTQEVNIYPTSTESSSLRSLRVRSGQIFFTVDQHYFTKCAFVSLMVSTQTSAVL